MRLSPKDDTIGGRVEDTPLNVLQRFPPKDDSITSGGGVNDTQGPLTAHMILSWSHSGLSLGANCTSTTLITRADMILLQATYFHEKM